MLTALRRWLALRMFGAADFIDPNRLTNMSIIVQSDGSRVVILSWGSLTIPVPVDNDDRFALARALTASVEELTDTDEWSEPV